jgi:hypothetical protein
LLAAEAELEDIEATPNDAEEDPEQDANEPDEDDDDDGDDVLRSLKRGASKILAPIAPPAQSAPVARSASSAQIALPAQSAPPVQNALLETPLAEIDFGECEDALLETPPEPPLETLLADQSCAVVTSAEDSLQDALDDPYKQHLGHSPILIDESQVGGNLAGTSPLSPARKQSLALTSGDYALFSPPPPGDEELAIKLAMQFAATQPPPGDDDAGALHIAMDEKTSALDGSPNSVNDEDLAKTLQRESDSNDPEYQASVELAKALELEESAPEDRFPAVLVPGLSSVPSSAAASSSSASSSMALPPALKPMMPPPPPLVKRKPIAVAPSQDAMVQDALIAKRAELLARMNALKAQNWP